MAATALCVPKFCENDRNRLDNVAYGRYNVHNGNV